MTNKTIANMWESSARARLTAQTANAAKSIGRLYGAIEAGQMTAQQADSEFRVLLTISTIKATVKPASDKHANKIYNLAAQYDMWLSETNGTTEYNQTINEAFNVFDRACVLSK